MINARAPWLPAMALMAALGAAVPAVCSTGFPIGHTSNDESTAGAAFDGTNFLVSYQERFVVGGTTGAKLVSPAGLVLATVAEPTGDATCIAFDGTNYLLAWTDHQNDPNATVRGLLVSKSGTKVGPSFTISQSTRSDEVIGLAFDGTNYLVVWVDKTSSPSRDVFGRFVSTAGVPQGSDFTIQAGGDNAAVAFASGTYLVSWTERDDQTTHARLVAPNGTMQSPFTISSTTLASDNPGRIGTDGTSFLVIWTDAVDPGPNNDWNFYGQIVSPAGALVGGVIPVCTAPGFQILPYVAFDGANYLVTWTDLASDANHDFVCDPGEGLCADVRGQFVSAAGVLVGENVLITPDTGFQGQTPVAYGAGKYLVVFGSGSPGTGNGDLDGTFVPTDFIAADGLESGTLLAWSAVSDDGGDLGPNSAAPLSGSFDLTGLVNDTNSLYVEDHTPLNEDHYRGRFLLDPDSFDPGIGQGHFRTRTFIVFEEGPTRRLAAIVLKRQGSQFSVMGRARRDDNTQADTGFFDITTAPHAIELEWKRATGSGSADGEFRLWIDGTLQSTMTGLQNNQSTVDFVRLGALSLKSGASGTLHWDSFESRRASYIGP